MTSPLSQIQDSCSQAHIPTTNNDVISLSLSLSLWTLYVSVSMLEDWLHVHEIFVSSFLRGFCRKIHLHVKEIIIVFCKPKTKSLCCEWTQCRVILGEFFWFSRFISVNAPSPLVAYTTLSSPLCLSHTLPSQTHTQQTPYVQLMACLFPEFWHRIQMALVDVFSPSSVHSLVSPSLPPINQKRWNGELI
jgi:hypothetical protein